MNLLRSCRKGLTAAELVAVAVVPGGASDTLGLLGNDWRVCTATEQCCVERRASPAYLQDQGMEGLVPIRRTINS